MLVLGSIQVLVDWEKWDELMGSHLFIKKDKRNDLGLSFGLNSFLKVQSLASNSQSSGC